MKRLITFTALLILSVAALPQPAFQAPAQSTVQSAVQSAAQLEDDPPDAAEHGVGRVSLSVGSVTVIRGDSGESLTATINEPLVAGDRISTGRGARAEVQFDSANVLRLDANSDVSLGDLQYRRYNVTVDRGAIIFRVLRDSDSRAQIHTPSVSIAPLEQGIYRVTVRPDGVSEIAVRAGQAEVVSPSGSERLSAGQTMLWRGQAGDPEFMNAAAPPFDDWDRWNADRDRFYERAPDVSRYVGPDIEGAQELGNYGRWIWDPAYGYVWTPSNVPQDWAPYRDGRWDYIDYYGWSWTSYDPWGWAPYHYGNWYRGPSGWAWYPGATGSRHYWRPALVGFFGFGSPGFGVSLGFGYGNVGWVPLAPHERFRPWYGRGDQYGRNDEYGRNSDYGRGFTGGRNPAIINNSNVAAAYRNARFEGAVTGMRVGEFGRASINHNGFVRPAAGDLTRAGVVNGGMPFAPVRSYGAGTAGRFTGRSNDRGSSDGRANSGRRDNVIRLDSAPANSGAPGSSGAPGNTPANTLGSNGWRRANVQPGERSREGNRTDVRIFSSERPAPQPVRISPSIVNNRYEAPARLPNGAAGDAGGTRPGNGPSFGAPPTEALPAHGNPGGNSEPYRAPQGRGEYRNAPPQAPPGYGNPSGNPDGYRTPQGRGEYRNAPSQAPPAYGNGGGNPDGYRTPQSRGEYRNAPPQAPPAYGNPGSNSGGYRAPRGRAEYRNAPAQAPPAYGNPSGNPDGYRAPQGRAEYRNAPAQAPPAYTAPRGNTDSNRPPERGGAPNAPPGGGGYRTPPQGGGAPQGNSPGSPGGDGRAAGHGGRGH